MPKVEERIVIASAADLQHHFDNLLPALQLVETEDSWQKIEKSLVKLEVITKSGGYKFDSFTSLFKGIAQPIINSLLSERTKLSGTAADLLNSVAPRLAERFESLVHVFAPTLLLICARTNKVALVRAKKCLLLIAKHCKLPSLLIHLREAAKDKSQTMRTVSVEVTLMLLEAVESVDKIGKRVADIEAIVKGTATDRDPEVRQWCKKVFEIYVDRWPERVSLFTSTFTPTTRRYLAPPKTANSGSSSHVAPRHALARMDIPSEQPKQRAPLSKPTPAVGIASTRSRMASSSSGPGTQVRAPSSSRQPLQKMATSASVAVPRRAVSTEATNTESGAAPTPTAEEERKRAALRANLLKQATGTPSGKIAARLALEQFEFQLRKSQKQSEDTGSTGGMRSGTEHPSSSAGSSTGVSNDRTLFNIAMAKKQSPRKGPSRIIAAAVPPPSSLRKGSGDVTSTKGAQRLTKSSSTPALSPSNVKDSSKFTAPTQSIKEEEEVEPDVFRSRPIITTTTRKDTSILRGASSKVLSSTSKSLNARGKLLGQSHAANRAKIPSSNSRRSVGKKVRHLKVDIGKENIPPGSELASILEPPALSPSTSPPGSPSAPVAKEAALSQQQPLTTKKADTVVHADIAEAVQPSSEEVCADTITAADHDPIYNEKACAVREEEREEQVIAEAHAASDVVTSESDPVLAVAPALARVSSPQADEEEPQMCKTQMENSAEVVHIMDEEALDQKSLSTLSNGTALDDWDIMAASLPSIASIKQESSSIPRRPPAHFAPSMSTPLRRPLGALQFNTTIQSLSSPLIRPGSWKMTPGKMSSPPHTAQSSSTTPSKIHLLPSSPGHTQIEKQEEIRVQPRKTHTILMASRKM